MKILSIVGARPQFIKVAVIADAFSALPHDERVDHRILHTGQHYDYAMSDSFFQQLGIPQADFYLGIGSGPHGQQTGAMLAAIEQTLADWRPDAVVVYGDTNSTLAGALAAAKMHIPVAHVEAGLRSFNRRMPEELNRVATDHLSDLLLCPTKEAVVNATREGLGDRAIVSGDVMLDQVQRFAISSSERMRTQLGFTPDTNYALVTMHRAENTDSPSRLDDLVTLLEKLPLSTVLPMHPRLRMSLGPQRLERLDRIDHLKVLPPCEYFDMLALERDARVILTDSGGVQKEAYFLGVPCLTMRGETEWTETLKGGWNRVLGTTPELLLAAVESLVRGNGYMPLGQPDLSEFGDGKAGALCAQAIIHAFSTCEMGVAS